MQQIPWCYYNLQEGNNSSGIFETGGDLRTIIYSGNMPDFPQSKNPRVSTGRYNPVKPDRKAV